MTTQGFNQQDATGDKPPTGRLTWIIQQVNYNEMRDRDRDGETDREADLRSRVALHPAYSSAPPQSQTGRSSLHLLRVSLQKSHSPILVASLQFLILNYCVSFPDCGLAS